MNLFDYMGNNTLNTESPLASRPHPTTLDEVVDQKHIVGKDKLLYRAIQADQLGFIIFYEPPGTGEATLAKVIASTTKASFRWINATAASKKDTEEVIKETKNAPEMYGKRTILFVDEMRRFNKNQQGYLLPFVEDETLVLIDATTEDSYFEVNGALISRSHIFKLKALEKEDIEELLRRTVYDQEKGMGSHNVEIEDDTLEFLTDVSNGDAGAALNAIELGILTTEQGEDGKVRINLEVVQECIQKRVVRYDKGGGNHYGTISAFIRSTRDSGPDAAVYYLTQMLYAGEDIKFIARRAMIYAAGDVGITDPMALTVAVGAFQTVERIGMPEAQIILSQIALYVATTPKSNSAVMVVSAAMDAVKSGKTMPVPVHLQDRHYKGAGKLGHGAGYLYVHNYPNCYVKQQYLPDGIERMTSYHPSGNGYEAQIQGHFREIQN